MKTLRTKNAESTKTIGMNLGLELKAGDVVALSGPLGAGKTVMVQGIAKALNIDEPITSPSYTIISEYEGILRLYHMDLYRLKSCEEFIWLGAEEMINGCGVTVVEWSERAENELPQKTIHVVIQIEKNGDRVIAINKSDGML